MRLVRKDRQPNTLRLEPLHEGLDARVRVSVPEGADAIERPREFHKPWHRLRLRLSDSPLAEFRDALADHVAVALDGMGGQAEQFEARIDTSLTSDV
jgi:hypothetical protein